MREERNLRHVHALLGGDQYAWLQEEAARRRRSVGEVLRTAVDALRESRARSRRRAIDALAGVVRGPRGNRDAADHDARLYGAGGRPKPRRQDSSRSRRRGGRGR